LIIDNSTANDSGTAGTAGTLGQKPLCQLTLVAGKAVYSLSPKILQVKRCQLTGIDYPLTGPITSMEADEQMAGWMGTSGTVGTAGTGGFPSSFMNDPINQVTFLLAPSASGTANMIISRLPLISFTLQTSPEIAEPYHEGLLNWAAHLAYMKNDSETLNLSMAKDFENRFTAQFGPLPDAYSESMRRILSQRGAMRPRRFGS